MFIADEVQPGFGRLGDHMWGHQKHGVVPDFVTLGKPMGNGHPIGGVVTQGDYLRRFQEISLYFNTFGGNPVSAAAGNAVLDVIEQEQLLDNARTVGAYVQSALHKLADKHELIGAIRGMGLFFGLELVADKKKMTPASGKARDLVNLMRRRGVLISKIGPNENVLKIRPPMPFQTDHADLLIETLDAALEDVTIG
jgi:4-aminobutyrate aminotransferase-like enzyme